MMLQISIMQMHQVRQEADMTIQEMKQRLARAEARLDEARSDGEWNAANEMVTYWRTLVDDAQQRRAA
jgi:hypothetical protein